MYKQLVEEWIPSNNSASRVALGKCFELNGKESYSYWKSFDESSRNFHIVPYKKREETKYMSVMEQIKRIIDEKMIVGCLHKGSKEWTSQHKWIEAEGDNMSYILGFQTLAFDESKILNCYLDKIQFYAFPKTEKGPNFYTKDKAGSIIIMYPSNIDGKFCAMNDRVVYNSGLTIEDKSETIAEKFQEFIKMVQKGKISGVWDIPRIYN